MIYTLTLNPAIDYIISADSFNIGMTNRTKEEKIYSGGKGINVSLMLNILGVKSTALGFIAGFTGDKIESDLKEAGINTDFIRLKDGFSRINIKLTGEKETEINGSGPDIPEKVLNELMTKIESLTADDMLVLSGSIPSSVSKTLYSDICGICKEKGIKTIVDGEGKILTDTLKYHPFLVKPNHHELGALFDTEIKSREDAEKYGLKLKEAGAVNVLVSLAEKGAVLIDEETHIHSLPAPNGKCINFVGSGDAMVAGFIAGYLNSGNYEDAFVTGLCSGSASAFSDHFADKASVDQLKKLIFSES